VGHGPRIFGWSLLGPPSFVLNFTFKFVWLTYTADNFQPAKFLSIWRPSSDGSDDIYKPVLGLIGFNNSESIFNVKENHHAGETFMLAPLPSSLASQWFPLFFHSRIATVLLRVSMVAIRLGTCPPSPLFRLWGYNMSCPPLCFFRFFIWRGFKYKNDVYDVFCEEVFMLDGRLYIATLMLKWNAVWCDITDSAGFYILASIKRFLAFFKFLKTAKDG